MQEETGDPGGNLLLVGGVALSPHEFASAGARTHDLQLIRGDRHTDLTTAPLRPPIRSFL